jgi:hypothetical protein
VRGTLAPAYTLGLFAASVTWEGTTQTRRAGFDAYATLFNKDSVFLSKVLNALLVAGGSKGAMKLMQDVLGVRKEVIEDNIAGRRKNFAEEGRGLKKEE